MLNFTRFANRHKAAVLTASLAALANAGPAFAQRAIGPQAAACDRNESAVLVKVEGFKSRTGVLRVQLYEANPRTFLEKGQYLQRIDIPVQRSGPMNVCVAVAKPGNYAVSVRHDVNGSGKSDLSDGGGISGNPSMSLMDILAKRKPDLGVAKFTVGGATREIRVVLNYKQGFSFRPIGA